MLTRTSLGILFAAGLAIGGIGATTASADTFRHHPPGPDRCWAWHHHHWIWVCHRPYDFHHPELSFYIGPFHHRHHHHEHGLQRGDQDQNGGNMIHKKKPDDQGNQY